MGRPWTGQVVDTRKNKVLVEDPNWLGDVRSAWVLAKHVEELQPTRMPSGSVRAHTTAKPAPAPPKLDEPQRKHERYLRWIRQHTCISCGDDPPNDAHHYPARGLGGAHGDDLQTVPLCRQCHDHWHSCGYLPGMVETHSREYMFRRQAELLARWVRRLEDDGTGEEFHDGQEL
jgi:hypothetical protein